MELALTSPDVLACCGGALQDWFLFLGGFHSLVVHFPIALVCLVPVLELYAWKRRDTALAEPIRFVLKLALLASLLAPLLGWMLVTADGYAGALVESHMLAGILVPVFCACALIFDRNRLKLFYGLTLVLAVVAVSLAGFLGGQIAHGKDHLTEHMPDGLRALTGIAQAMPVHVDTSTYFGGRVAPIISARCVGCHGAEKSKGQLRLDNYEAIMKGGRSGAIVVSGDAASSELYRRITLAQDHKDFMPGGDNPPLTAAETAIIGRWIERGAMLSASIAAIEDGAVFVAPETPVEVVMPAFDPGKIETDRRQLAGMVSSLQLEYPNVLAYESRSSADLELNAAMTGRAFGDADLAVFAPVADRIVRADLAGTSITDASGTLIESMTRLRKLRIGDTAISDQVVAKLTVLRELKSLNIAGIEITDRTRNALLRVQGLAITATTGENQQNDRSTLFAPLTYNDANKKGTGK